MTLQLNDISLRFNYFTLRFQSLHRDAPFRSEISKTISLFLEVTNFVSSYCSAIRYVSSIILSHTWRVQCVYAKIYLFLATKNWKELCFRSFLCVRHLPGQVEQKMETQVAAPQFYFYVTEREFFLPQYWYPNIWLRKQLQKLFAIFHENSWISYWHMVLVVVSQALLLLSTSSKYPCWCPLRWWFWALKAASVHLKGW